MRAMLEAEFCGEGTTSRPQGRSHDHHPHARNLVLTVDATGTTFRSFDDDDNATATYETHFDNFTFADLGSELTIALRQEAVQDGDPVMGFFDSITVTTEEPGGFLLGDVNLDGEVNGLDVDPFVDVLLTGPYQPEADMNEDQVVNGLDVDPFVAAVVGGGVQQIPEPSTFLLCLIALGVVGGWQDVVRRRSSIQQGNPGLGCFSQATAMQIHGT